MPSLEVERIHVRFPQGGAADLVALDDVSLACEAGHLMLLMGPSGSGKTTLLSVMGCILPPSSGRVLIAEIDTSRFSENERTALRRQHIGFVFQAFRLMNSLTAEENVALPLTIQGRTNDEALDRARSCLAELGLSSKRGTRAERLSGGEKQRVAIARAVVTGAQIILADEPTASLDSSNGMAVAEMLALLADEQGRAVVVVSHDERLMRFAHRVVRLLNGKVIT